MKLLKKLLFDIIAFIQIIEQAIVEKDIVLNVINVITPCYISKRIEKVKKLARHPQ